MSLVCLPAGDVYVDVSVKENDIETGVSKVLEVIRPTWKQEHIKFKMFTDGITNKLLACQLNTSDENTDNIVLIRIYGNKTDLLIDREAELRNIKTLNTVGLAPRIYAVFENGIAYQYYPGVTLNTETVLDGKIWPLVARHMAKMHKVVLGKEAKKEPMLWNKIEQFLCLLPDPFSIETKQNRFVNSFGSVTRLRIEYERLKSYLTKTKSPLVFAHNDLLLGNVIYNKDEGAIHFIDYEYAAYNYQSFDLANHFNEFVGVSIVDINYDRYPSKEFQSYWINVYLTEYLNTIPSAAEITKVYNEVQQMALASHFMWGIWSLVQYEHSHIEFDFGKYAEIRLNRYFELKGKVYKELSY